MNELTPTETGNTLADETTRVEELLARSKLEVQEMVASELVDTLADLKERMHGSTSVDDAIKVSRLLTELHGGWSKKEKTDPNDNLPIFNIVINGGGMQVTQLPSDAPLIELPPGGDWLATTIETKFAPYVDINQDIQDA